jgi:hypothetical protein
VLKMDNPDSFKEIDDDVDDQGASGDDQSINLDKSTDPPKSSQRLNKENETTIQKEAMLMQVLDGLRDYPLKFTTQKKAQAEILNMVNVFLDSRPSAKEYWSQPERNITASISTMFQDGERLVVEKGFKHSPQKLSRLITFTSLGIALGVLVALAIAGMGTFALTYYFLIICVLCFIPKIIKKWMGGKLGKFQALSTSEFVQSHAAVGNLMHDMAQYLLTDLHEILMDSGSNILEARFRLWNSDYRDIKVLDSKFIPGMNKTMFDVRFLKDDEDSNALETPDHGHPDVDFEIESSTTNPSTNDEIDVDEIEAEKNDDT